MLGNLEVEENPRGAGKRGEDIAFWNTASPLPPSTLYLPTIGKDINRGFNIRVTVSDLEQVIFPKYFSQSVITIYH